VSFEILTVVTTVVVSFPDVPSCRQAELFRRVRWPYLDDGSRKILWSYTFRKRV